MLIVAEHASLKFGGEASLPIRWLNALRKQGVECWLLVHERTKAELDEMFADDGKYIRYVPDLWIHRFLWKIGTFLPGRLGVFSSGALLHYVTQVLQRKVARDLIKDFQISFVLEPIPVSPRLPSMMHGLGVPIIIGPMNGGMSYPPAFKDYEGWIERKLIPLGRAFSSIANALIPGKRRAALLLVANERTRTALPRSVRHVPVVEIVENAVVLDDWSVSPPSRVPRAGVCRFAFAGRLIELKGVDILLQAFGSYLKNNDGTLDIYGDGSIRKNLEDLATRLEIAEKVRWHGYINQLELSRRLTYCDVFILPSLHECGGAVVLEAMALGKPVIATDWGGPKDYLDEQCGVLVKPTSRAEFQSGLSAAMSLLAEQPEYRNKLGEHARRKVEEHFNWDGKAMQLIKILSTFDPKKDSTNH